MSYALLSQDDVDALLRTRVHALEAAHYEYELLLLEARCDRHTPVEVVHEKELDVERAALRMTGLREYAISVGAIPAEPTEKTDEANLLTQLFGDGDAGEGRDDDAVA